jgi:hypothetical protein
MNTILRLGLIASACVGLSGCLPLPSPFEYEARQQLAENRRCSENAAMGIAVSEPMNAAVPADEGKVEKYEPVFWMPAFTGEGYPQREPKREPTEGTLALTEKSIVFLPRADIAGVHVPYAAVLGVEPSSFKSTSVVIIESICGRFDLVTFWQLQSNAADREAANAAIATIKARVAAAHRSVGKASHSPQ